MDRQLASFLNKYGSIDVYSQGLLITFRGFEPIYLGGEMIVHFNLFLTFMELRSRGLARSFEGDVSRESSVRGAINDLGSFAIRSRYGKRYEVKTVSSSGKTQKVMVGTDFLNDFCEAMKHWFDCMKDNEQVDMYKNGKDWWYIRGSIKGTPLKYRINRHSFLIEVPELIDGQERYYVFSTEADDYELWMEALYKSKMLLSQKWKEGSWFNILAADDKVIRIQLEGGQVYLSLYDPNLATLNVTLGSDLQMLNFLRKLLKEVWQEEAMMSTMEELLVDEDD